MTTKKPDKSAIKLPPKLYPVRRFERIPTHPFVISKWRCTPDPVESASESDLENGAES